MMHESFNPREKRAILFLGSAHALTHAMMLSFPAILIPLMDELDLGLFGVGVLGNIGYLLFGVGALPAGFLSDRWGPRKMLFFFFAGACISCLAIFLSRGILTLAIGLLLSGASASLYHPAGLSYITRKVRSRGKALGYHGMAGNVGLAAAPVMAAWSAVNYGWRSIYIVLAILFGIMAIVDCRSTFWDEGREREGLDEDSGRTLSDGTERASLVVLYLMLILAGFIYRGALTYLPTYLSSPTANGKGWDLTVSQAGSMTTFALLLGIVSQWIGGNLSQRIRLEYLGLLLILLALPFLFLMGHSGGVMLMAMTALFIFFYFCWQPVSNGLIAQYTHHSFRSLGFGLSFTLSFGAGSFASSVAGKIGDEYGLDKVFIFLGVLLSGIAILSVVLVFLARKRRGREEQKVCGY